MKTANLIEGLPAAARADARVLVLGSMPGARSLQAGEYYAHPRNQFWPIMGALIGAWPALPHAQRLKRLADSGIALWDVMAACERAGSLDSAIRDSTVCANDFNRFFVAHPKVRAVLFNGAKAEASFRRHVPSAGAFDMAYRRLPSTSPANAAQSGASKLAAWRDALHAAGVAVATSA